VRFPTGKRQVIPLAFIILSVGSVAYIISAAANYLQYYPALTQLRLRISTITFYPVDTSGSLGIKAQIILDNPTDYSGLGAGTLFLTVRFSSPNASFNQGQPLIGSESVARSIGPRSETNLSLVIQLAPNVASSFQSFYNHSPGQVTAHTSLTIDILTFLFVVTGPVKVGVDQDLPLS